MTDNSLQEELDRYGIDLVRVFNVENYGPLAYLKEKNEDKQEIEQLEKKFVDGVYATATARSDSVNLYELSNTKVKVPKPFRFLIGRANSNGKPSILVYVPSPYLDDLKNAQTDDVKVRNEHLREGIRKQQRFFDKFNAKSLQVSQDFLDDYFANVNLKELAINGNQKQKLPPALIESLATYSIASDDKKLPIGTFIPHIEEITLPNGDKKTITLELVTKQDSSSKNTYQKKDKTITEKIENYSISYKLYSR